MSEFISFAEIIESLGLRDFEAAELLLVKNKIQPYSQTGATLHCPNEYHQIYIEKKKQYDSVKKELDRANFILTTVPINHINTVFFNRETQVIPASRSRPFDEVRKAVSLYISNTKKMGFKIDLNIEPHQFDQPIYFESPHYPGRKNYFTNLQLIVLKDLYDKAERNYPELFEQARNLEKDLKEISEGGWDAFDMPCDDKNRQKLIIYLRDCFIKKADFATAEKKDGILGHMAQKKGSCSCPEQKKTINEKPMKLQKKYENEKQARKKAEAELEGYRRQLGAINKIIGRRKYRNQSDLKDEIVKYFGNVNLLRARKIDDRNAESNKAINAEKQDWSYEMQNEFQK